MGVFSPGSMIILTLAGPREKFWGALLSIQPAGIAVCGIDLNSFDEYARLARAGEALPTSVFFPMHRVERMETDAPATGVTSLSEQFRAISGANPSDIFLGAR